MHWKFLLGLLEKESVNNKLWLYTDTVAICHHEKVWIWRAQEGHNISTIPSIATEFACNSFPLFQEIQDLLFLGRREEGEGCCSYSSLEKHTCHETFLFSWKQTNNGKNIALSKFGLSPIVIIIVKLFKSKWDGGVKKVKRSMQSLCKIGTGIASLQCRFWRPNPNQSTVCRRHFQLVDWPLRVLY